MPSSDKHARTEPPTPKRKKEAREDGRVARSPDVAGWAALVVGSFLFPWLLGRVKGQVLGVLGQATRVATAPSRAAALGVFQSGLKVVITTIVPLGIAFALLAIVANVAQTGRSFSFKAARPKFDRLSPKTGAKRLVSPQMGVELLKQVLKLTLLVGASYQVVVTLARELTGKLPVSLLPMLVATASSILGFVRTLALLGLAIGLADYLYQRHKLQQSLKMTKEEVKEEHKAAEGDPHVKGMMKKRMYTIARSKLMVAVRNADVVVTNPTHFAVALQYDTKRSGAPRVVAKGADLLAARIRAEAAVHSVPLVEDPPLARYLYALCEVDEQIPGEIYLAVARLLAFVYSLPPIVRGLGVHRPPHSEVPFEPAAVATLSETQRRKVAAVLSGGAA